MGRYLVTVSGTDRKSEIISEVYRLSKYNDEVENACKTIYEREWISYEPTNIEIDVLDVDNLYKSFKVDEKMERVIEHEIYNKKRSRSDLIIEALTENLGRKPTQQEILTELRAICDGA